MALDPTKIARLETSATNPPTGQQNCRSFYFYETSADTLATVQAQDYFATLTYLQVGDIIMIKASDATSISRVNALPVAGVGHQTLN